MEKKTIKGSFVPRTLTTIALVVMLVLLPSVAPAMTAGGAAPVATEAPAAEEAAESVALEDAAETEAEADPGVDVVMSSQAGDASVFEPGSTKADFFADYRFPGIQSLHGILSSTSMYITQPDYMRAENATMRLSYTCSDLIIERLSSITLYFNGIAFFSCNVTYNAEGPTVVYADLPMELFQDDFNLLEIGAYVRLIEEEGCIDDYMGANWINIGEDTCLRVGYSHATDSDLLKYYPFPFLSAQGDDGRELTVAVSDAMDHKELEAGLLTMADLGDYVVTRNEIGFSTIGNAKSENIILFSLMKNLTPEYRQMLDGNAIPPRGALIKRVFAPGGERLLVVSDSGSALTEAARLLADNARVKQIGGTAHIVMEGESGILMRNSELSDMVIKGEYTLKEIHGSGIRLTGPFRQEATVSLPVPNDYALSAESKFTIRFRHSENLDFNRSLVTVYWGDVPIASKKLTLEGATGNSITVVAPADLVGSIGSYVRIAFDLEIRDLICTSRQSQMPWAYVSEDSTFYLPSGKTGTLNLKNRPAPFQRDGMLNDVMAIIPDEPDASELLLIGRTLSAFGMGSSPYGALKAIRASDFSTEDADYNIIAVGIGSRNKFIRNINDHMYIPYEVDYNRFAPNAYLTIAYDYAGAASAVELIYSPYADDRAVLVLTSPIAEGISALTQFISSDRLRWNLVDDVVMVDNRLRATSFQCYVAPPTEEAKPSFVETISAGGQSVVFTLIALGVMLLLLLSVVLVLVRLRMRNK